MNVISRILNEPSIARGDYVFDSDHMFFSEYSKRLQSHLMRSIGQRYCGYQRNYYLQKSRLPGFCVGMVGVRQTQITLRMI